MTDSLHRTALADAHLRAGARLVDFAGWLMPVQYTGIMDEHRTVRTAAGLFDISHMGEVIVRGAAAAHFLNRALTNDIETLGIGQGQYTLMTNDQGGVIDDLIVYRLEENEYYAVVNASKRSEDVARLRELLAGFSAAADVELCDISDEVGALALQGPKAAEILASFLDTQATDLPDYFWSKRVSWQRIDRFLIARTGYTGEDGFELFFPVAQSEAVWDALLQAGEEFGLKPAGLGARDTLRLEACYPLNGNDLGPDRTPLEAGLGFAVALGKPRSFPGKEVLVAQKAEGLPTRLVALRLTGKGAPPRAHYPVVINGKTVGELTSGCLSPTLGTGIGLAYLPREHAKAGTAVDIQVRQNRVSAEVVKKPFYKRG